MTTFSNNLKKERFETGQMFLRSSGSSEDHFEKGLMTAHFNAVGNG